MKKMKVMSLIMALVIAVAIFAGCNANPSTESGYTQEQIDALQVENETLQDSLNNLHKEFDGLQTAKNVLQSDLDVLKLESDSLKEEVEALRIENGTLQITIDELAVSSAAPPASSSSSSAPAPASRAASSPASSAPAPSSTASAVQTASSGYVGAKDECYPINEGGKWYIVLCNKIPAAVAGRKDTITSDIVECGSCGVKINRAGQVVSGSSGTGGATSSGSASASTVDTAAYAREVIRLTNAERIKAGLDELYVVEDMMSAALLRAQEYSEDTSRGHRRPDGTTGPDLASSYSSEGMGLENLSWGRNTPSAAVSAWMNSTAHKAAILGEGVTGIAVGCYQKGGTLYWCQLFIC